MKTDNEAIVQILRTWAYCNCETCFEHACMDAGLDAKGFTRLQGKHDEPHENKEWKVELGKRWESVESFIRRTEEAAYLRGKEEGFGAGWDCALESARTRINESWYPTCYRKDAIDLLEKMKKEGDSK